MSTSCGWKGKSRYGSFTLVDETQGVQVKLCYPLTMRAIPESLRDASRGGAIQIDYLYEYQQYSIHKQVVRRPTAGYRCMAGAVGRGTGPGTAIFATVVLTSCSSFFTPGLAGRSNTTSHTHTHIHTLSVSWLASLSPDYFTAVAIS